MSSPCFTRCSTYCPSLETSVPSKRPRAVSLPATKPYTARFLCSTYIPRAPSYLKPPGDLPHPRLPRAQPGRTVVDASTCRREPSDRPSFGLLRLSQHAARVRFPGKMNPGSDAANFSARVCPTLTHNVASYRRSRRGLPAVAGVGSCSASIFTSTKTQRHPCSRKGAACSFLWSDSTDCSLVVGFGHTNVV